jgi:WD40 repeat protein
MAMLNNNVIKLVYGNIDLNRTSLFQNRIKNKSLLENVLSVIKINLKSFHAMKPIVTLKNFKYAVYAIEMLRNGNLIIGSNDGLIKVFDPSSNFACVKELSIHQQSVYTILVLKNGNIITRSWDKLILWNPITFDYKQLVGHNNHIRAVLELENGYLVSSGGNRELILWDEDIYVNTKLVNDTIAKLQLLSNNTFLGLTSQYIYIFDYDLNIISQHKHDTSAVPITFEALNTNLICCYEKRFIEVYDTSLSIVNRIQVPGFTDQFAKLKEQDIITVCDKTITVWNAYKQSEEQVYQCDLVFQKIFSFKNCLAITTSKDNKCRLWYYNKRIGLLNTFGRHDKEINYIQLIGDYLITASFDNTCMIYKINN